MKVAVVGAGVHGASSAWALSKRGHEVTVFEQHPLGHSKGSSHGNSRIVRKAYPDAFYTAIMQEGYPLWHELERDSGKKILRECGLLYFGSADAPNMKMVAGNVQGLGVAHELVDRSNCGHVFPDLILKQGEIGVFTPEAGWAHASLAIRTSLELAQSKGATIRQERVQDLEPLKKEFARVVLCQGPWIRMFVDLPVTVTLQSFGYVVGEHHGPVWIEDGPYSMYGFPSEPWHPGIKVGVHYQDKEVDPDDLDRTPAPQAIEIIQDLAWRRFGHDRPRVADAKGCLYTNRSNEDFILGRLDEQVYYASPCTGHGFKFGPWIGKTMADFVEGKQDPADYPRFLVSHP